MCDEILEQSVRAAIPRLPDETYGAVDHLDDCGPDIESIRIEVALTVQGDELTLDFGGSSPQTRSGMNAVANYPRAYPYFARPSWSRGTSARAGCRASGLGASTGSWSMARVTRIGDATDRLRREAPIEARRDRT